jgi:hypothetical protein
MQTRRRPPLDPTAALRPKGPLEKQAMNSFRRKVNAANDTSICGASSLEVGRKTMREIIESNTYCVPIFQRRYCWSEVQWQTLLNDVLHRRSTQHSLGRLTCTSLDGNGQTSNKSLLTGIEGRSIILDGQQRFTTTTILLSAIRDLIQEQSISGAGSKHEYHIDEINNLLFSDMVQMHTWLNDSSSQLQEGIVLPFARLVPTYCDRRSYFEVILPLSSDKSIAAEHLSSTWHRTLEAKQYFMKMLRLHASSITVLMSVLRGVLDSVTMLNFPVDTSHGRDDGTEDLMVVYERLALRDATWCKPQRKTEYMSMSGADMIRNLLLGSFEDQAEASQFYNECWLPLEKKTSEHRKTLDEVLKEFLHKQNIAEAKESENTVTTEQTIGGQTYADFQAWFDKKQTGTHHSGSLVVWQVGKQLAESAQY